MKKMTYKFLPVLILLLSFSCQEAEFVRFSDEYVALESPSSSIAESTTLSLPDGSSAFADNTMKITVYRSTSDFSQDLIVNMTVSYTFVEDTELTSAGEDASADFTLNKDISSLVIPAGKASTSFMLTAINDLSAKGDKQIVFEITGTSSGNFKLGQQDSQIGKSLTITANDDDCPIALSDWIGIYTVDEVFTAGGNEGLTLAGAFGESYELEFTALASDPTGTKVVITNTAGNDTYIADGTVMSFITCTGEVSFDSAPLNLALFANLTIQVSSYTEGSKVISASGPLGNFGPYEFVLTKQ